MWRYVLQPLSGHALPDHRAANTGPGSINVDSWPFSFLFSSSSSFFRPTPARICANPFDIPGNLAEELHVTIACMKQSDGYVSYTGVVSALSSLRQQTFAARIPEVSSLCVTMTGLGQGWKILVNRGLRHCILFWPFIDMTGLSLTLASASLRFFPPHLWTHNRGPTARSGNILAVGDAISSGRWQ